MAQTAQQAAPPAGAAPTADPAPPSGVDQRIDRIEATQREQGQVLERVLAAVTGGAPTQGQHAAPAGQAPPQAGDIAAQVRREIQDADERRRREEDDATWRAGVSEVVEQVKREKAPREPETGWRARLQRAIVGKEPS